MADWTSLLSPGTRKGGRGQNDYIAQMLMQQGMDQSPIQSPLQGLARMAQAYVGKGMMDDGQAKTQQGNQTLADLLAPPTDNVTNGPQQSAPLPGGGSVDYQTPQISTQADPKNAQIAALLNGGIGQEAFTKSAVDQLGYGKPKDPVKLGENDRLLDPTDFHQLVGAAPKQEDYTHPLLRNGQPNTGLQDWELKKQKAGEAPAWANVDLSRQRLSIEKQRAGEDSFGAPTMIGYTGPDGEEIQTAGIYNKKTGTYMDAATHQPISNPQNLRVIGNATGGGRSMGMAGRVSTAALDAASDIENLSGIGTGAGMGLFANATTSPLSALSRTLTPQEVQDTQTTMAGLSRAMSLLGSGGMQGSDTVMKSFDALQPNTGDSMLTTMRKLGSFRQQATNGIDAAIASPMYSPAQKKQLNDAKARLATAVPWTPHDVQALENNGNSGLSMHDVYSAKLGKSPGAPAQVSSDDDYAKLPSGTVFVGPDGHQRKKP